MNLKTYLTLRGEKYQHFAARVGVTPQAVWFWLNNGKRHPSPRTMARILSATDGQVTPNDFFKPLSSDGDTQPTKNPKQSL
jgi:DNA-binding transcriptional regulator YdaS (Cro superfamily)